MLSASGKVLWEAGQFRRRFFDEDELPAELARIADLGDVNVAIVPWTATRYHEYETAKLSSTKQLS